MAFKNGFLVNMTVDKSISKYKVLLLFICILNMGGVLSLALPYNLIDFIPMLLSIGYLMHKKRGLLRGNTIKALILCFILLILSSVLTGVPLMNYKGFFLRLIIAYLVLSVFAGDCEDIRIHLVVCLKLIAVLAVINFILYMTVPYIFYPIETSSGYHTNTFFYFFNYKSLAQLFGQILYRNQGVFWEPGVLQIPMNILAYNQLVVERKDFKSVIIPMFVIITTMSTTGLFLFALIVAFRFLFIKKRRLSFKQVFLFILMLFLFVPLLKENTHDKLQGAGASSTAYRFQDVLLAYSFARDYPLLGIGFDSEKYQRLSGGISLQTYEGIDVESERGNSNTISEVLVFLGIPMLLLFLIALFKQNIFPHSKMAFIVLVISFATEPLLVTTIVLLIVLSSTCRPLSQISIGNNKTYEISN